MSKRPIIREIVTLAKLRTGSPKKQDRGWNWACYCAVCCAIRTNSQHE